MWDLAVAEPGRVSRPVAECGWQGGKSERSQNPGGPLKLFVRVGVFFFRLGFLDSPAHSTFLSGGNSLRRRRKIASPSAAKTFQSLAQRVDFFLAGVLFAFGLVKDAQDFVEFLQHFLELRLNVARMAHC